MSTVDVGRLRSIAKTVRQLPRYYNARPIAAQYFKRVSEGAKFIREAERLGAFQGDSIYGEIGKKLADPSCHDDHIGPTPAGDMPVWRLPVWYAVVDTLAPEWIRKRSRSIATDANGNRSMRFDTSPEEAEIVAMAIEAEADRLSKLKNGTSDDAKKPSWDRTKGELAALETAREKLTESQPPAVTPSEAKFQWTPPMLEGYVFALLKEVEYPTQRKATEWIAAKSGRSEPSRSTLVKTYAWQNRPQKTPKPRTTNEAQSGVSPAQNADAAVSHKEVTDAVLDIEEKLHRQLVDDERDAVAWELQQAGADEEERDEAIRQLIQGFGSGDM